jgi:POT family proton-dependent oligopeptide transporter
MTYVLVGIAVAYFAYVFIAGRLNADEKKRVMVIAVLFVAASVFWAAFEQAPTSLNLFAKDFTDRQFGSFEVPALWYQSINSFFIIIFAPIFAALWTWLGKRNINISSPVKFALGLALAGVGFLIMVYPANMLVAANGAIKVSSIWLAMSYLFQTFGELSLSPVGLSSMTKLSPRRFVGQMMGIWFLATAVGNLIAGLVGGSVDPEKLEQTPQLFVGTTIALFVAAAVLGLLAIPISRMMPLTLAATYTPASPPPPLHARSRVCGISSIFRILPRPSVGFRREFFPSENFPPKPVFRDLCSTPNGPRASNCRVP